MKLSKLSRTILVSSAGLVLATLLTSCEIETIDYLFVANSAGTGSSTSGEIQTFDIDSESGAIRNGPSPVSSGGNNPVAIAITADYANLYVVNQASNNVVHFSIAASGVLTQKDMVTTGPGPTSISVNTAQTYLYVVSGPNPAMLTAYSLSGGTIGSIAAQETLSIPGYAGDTLAPTGVTVLPNNNAVFVTAYDQSAYNPGGTTTSIANPGWVFGYTVGTGGALTSSTGSPWKAGVKPVALAADPTNRFVYVTDFASNQMIGYTIQSGSVLDFMINGPFSAGSEPNSLVVDPRGLVYLRIRRTVESGHSFQHLSGYRDSDRDDQHNGKPDKFDRYRTGFDCCGRGAGEVRLHGKLSGQFGLRIPAESG